MTERLVFGPHVPKPRQVAVVGSRDYGRLDLVRDFVLRLPDGSTVISGGARGVDETAVNVAKARGLEAVVFRPDWQKHGCAAGPMRNVEIVARAKEVIAFWNGTSRGTLNTIALAHRAGVPVVVLDANGDLMSERMAVRAAEELGIVAAIERAGLAHLVPPRPDPREDHLELLTRQLHRPRAAGDNEGKGHLLIDPPGPLAPAEKIEAFLQEMEALPDRYAKQRAHYVAKAKEWLRAVRRLNSREP